MTKHLAADATLFLALAACDVPRDLADRVQERCRLRDVVTAANRIVEHSRHAEWQTRARELAFSRVSLKALVRQVCQEIINNEYPLKA